MSNSAIGKAKRIIAVLLVGVFISGTVPFSPLDGVTPQPMVVKASSDDITKLLQDDSGYYYYLPDQGTDDLDLSKSGVNFTFGVRTESGDEGGYNN